MATGAELSRTGICSGEGGMLPEEQGASGRVALMITGVLRVPMDFVKALALGADGGAFGCAVFGVQP